MLESLRRHIMMQQGGKKILGIGGNSNPQIRIPTTLPTNSIFAGAHLSIEFYIRREIFAYSIPYSFTYNKLGIGINGFNIGGNYNHVRIGNIGYGTITYAYTIDTSKIIVDLPQITMLDRNGAIISQSQMVVWLGITPVGGDLILQPNHYISRISAPGYFDLVSAEEGGRLGFRDTLSGTFYGQTNSEGELVALYEE